MQIRVAEEFTQPAGGGGADRALELSTDLAGDDDRILRLWPGIIHEDRPFQFDVFRAGDVGGAVDNQSALAEALLLRPGGVVVAGADLSQEAADENYPMNLKKL